MTSWLKFLFLLLSFQINSFALVEVSKLFPAGAQKGTDAHFLLEGKNLAHAKDILFYKTGIHFEKMELEKNKLKLHLKISKKASTGLHPFRILGEDGLSNMRYIHIAPFPEHKKASNIFSFDKAQEVSIPCTVNGQLNGRQIDHYRFELKKGQSLNASLTCMDLALTFTDCQIKIFDKDKKQIAYNDDCLLLKQDPMISFTAPYTGVYYVQVHDFRFGGGNYRLHLSPKFNGVQVFPAGGPLNQKQKVLCLYQNGTSAQKEIDPQNQTGINSVYIDKDSIHHISFHVSKHKNFFDQEKGYERDKATSCDAFPLALNGRLDQKQDVDWFSFKAPKDGQIEIQVLARQLRSPIDALLEFYSSQGKLIKKQDDSGSLDPKIITKVKKDETYFIKIRDFNKNFSPLAVYRILVDYQEAQLKLSLSPSQQRTHQGQLLNISPNNNQLLIFDLNRENADSAISYQFSNLPSALTYKVLSHPEKSTKIPVLYSLKKDSPLQAQHISAQLSNKELSKGEYKESLIMLMGPNNKEYRHYSGNTLAYASTVPSPFSLEVLPNTSPMPRFGTHTSKIRIHRQEGFKGEITIKAKSVLAGLSMRDQIKIPADKNEVDYSIQASSSTPLGNWPFVFNATGYDKGKVFTLSSDAQERKVVEHYFDLKMLQYSLHRGKEREITIDINVHKTPDFPIKASLKGLPNGVTAEDIVINKIDEKLSFKISANENASYGYHRNSYVYFEFTHEGHKLNQSLRTNGTIYVPKPKKKK
ncbi:PPC domain-containing protein [Lentisphaera marina]|uniref:PPC domain-containing protein n=1 Tax=Lentisphaera marina TaxID=1111041 RepID=UPI002365DED6|nr:PPC domain-containing protein [Lentisphaera marina]MDD7986381.1 PPC domain-containing protein [Lentisphaera marina]